MDCKGVVVPTYKDVFADDTDGFNCSIKSVPSQFIIDVSKINTMYYLYDSDEVDVYVNRFFYYFRTFYFSGIFATLPPG